MCEEFSDVEAVAMWLLLLLPSGDYSLLRHESFLHLHCSDYFGGAIVLDCVLLGSG